MKLVKEVLTEAEAMAYCDAHPGENLFVERTLGGVFEVWDMDAKGSASGVDIQIRYLPRAK
jgi:hypothetical protein